MPSEIAYQISSWNPLNSFTLFPLALGSPLFSVYDGMCCKKSLKQRMVDFSCNLQWKCSMEVTHCLTSNGAGCHALLTLVL